MLPRLTVHPKTFLLTVEFLILAVCVVGCGKGKPSEKSESRQLSGNTVEVADAAAGGQSSLLTLEPLKPAKAKSEKLFESLPASECGIGFVPKWKPRNQFEALLLKTGFTGGGVCLGDFDADGLPDLFLTRSHGGGVLYKNLGDFQFKDVTVAAGVSRPDDWHTGATFSDLNNDGNLDLVVGCHDSANRLFLNNGDGTFRDIAAAAGLDFAGASVKTIFADYDQDGDLDAYLVTNRLEPKTPTKIRYTGKPGAYGVAPEHQELAMVINLPSGEQKFAKAGQFDRLYRNDLSPRWHAAVHERNKRGGTHR